MTTWISFKDRTPETGDLFFLANSDEVFDELDEWCKQNSPEDFTEHGWTHWMKVERPSHLPQPELPGSYRWEGKLICSMSHTFSVRPLAPGEGHAVLVEFQSRYRKAPEVGAVPFWVFEALKKAHQL